MLICLLAYGLPVALEWCLGCLRGVGAQDSQPSPPPCFLFPGCPVQMVAMPPAAETAQEKQLQPEGNHKAAELLGESVAWDVGLLGWPPPPPFLLLLGILPAQPHPPPSQTGACFAPLPLPHPQPRWLSSRPAHLRALLGLCLHADVDGLPHVGAAVWPGQQYYNAVDLLTGPWAR